jgi:hypothetical protein
MKTFTVDIIPKIRKFSRTLEDLSIFTNHQWVLLNEVPNSKTVYIFRQHKRLLVSENGVVTKGSWEYLGHNSILLETNSHALLLKHSFADEHIMAMKIDGKDGYLFLINETKFGPQMESIEDVSKFLEKKYFEKDIFATALPVANNGTPTYKESYPVKSFDFTYGRHDKIYISFADGINGKLLKGYSTKRYFFNHTKLGKKYFDDKEECVIELYKHKKFES